MCADFQDVRSAPTGFFLADGERQKDIHRKPTQLDGEWKHSRKNDKTRNTLARGARMRGTEAFQRSADF